MAGLALWSRQLMRGPTDVLETGLLVSASLLQVFGVI